VLNLITDFKASTEDEAFVGSNSSQSFDSKFYKKGELAPRIDTFAFAGKQGDVSAPYFDGDYVKVDKISKIEMMSDSVKARHILVKSGDAQKTADSLKQLIETGADFATLAFKHSEDPGSKTAGGDLGWFKQGMMVRPFNDTCFLGKTKKIYSVNSQFGIHIIEVLEKSTPSKMVQVATIAAKIEPSTATRSKVYSEASKFAGENTTAELFTKTIENVKSIQKKTANDLKPADRNVPGLQQARQIVRWAYEAEKGQTSNVFDCGTMFVVANLKNIKEKGYAKLDDVKQQIELAVIKKKKAQKILSEVKGAGAYSTLEDLSSKLPRTSVLEANGVTFGSASVPNVGYEPKVAGVATQLEIGKLSNPIEGNSGVYVIIATKKDSNPVTNPRQEQDQNTRMLKSRTGYFSIVNLKESADIEDNRISFE
jgi:peptidyl-prolyl cis-trans isomerase D